MCDWGSRESDESQICSTSYLCCQCHNRANHTNFPSNLRRQSSFLIVVKISVVRHESGLSRLGGGDMKILAVGSTGE